MRADRRVTIHDKNGNRGVLVCGYVVLYRLFFVTASLILSAIAQAFVFSPPAGSVLSEDLNKPGHTSNCIGYANIGGVWYQR